MVISEDFDYSLSPFAVQAVFTISVGVTVTTKGHFTNATESVQIAEGRVETYDASFSCNSSAIGQVKNDMSVVINATTYKVKRRERLGTGDTLIYLKTP